MESALRIKASDFRSDHPEKEDQEIPDSHAEGLGGFQLIAFSTRISMINPFIFTYFHQLAIPFFPQPVIPPRTITIPFDDYVKSSHFQETEEELYLKIFQDLTRDYASFNGENLIERAWTNLKRSDFPTFTEARGALFRGPNWKGIEEKVQDEFILKVLPEFIQQTCKGMDPLTAKAFMGSFYQASGSVFYSILEEARGASFPYRTLEDSGEVTKNGEKIMFIFRAIFGEQIFTRKNGKMELLYGSAMEEIVGTVDFSHQTVSISITPKPNPFYGQQINSK